VPTGREILHQAEAAGVPHHRWSFMVWFESAGEPVDGSKTPSGKPYVGRTKQSSPAKRGKRDGRDRTDAEIVDTYDPSDAAAARRAEQNAMNREGGMDNLDNKRKEIRPEDWKRNGVDPPQ
jgi:hypothetical protein